MAVSQARSKVTKKRMWEECVKGKSRRKYKGINQRIMIE